MVVYFIRHGETDFNKRCLIQGMSDIPLNDKGIHQAEGFFKSVGAGKKNSGNCIRQNF